MPRKAIPEKVWQKIRNDWAAGIPITTLADAYGISKQTIYNKKTQELSLIHISEPTRPY